MIRKHYLNYAFTIDEGVSYTFPSSSHTVVARGKSFTSGILLSAYEQGIFPWGRDNEGFILWCAPKIRCVLYPSLLYINKSNKKVIKNHSYIIKLDTNFKQTITNCAKILRTKHNTHQSSWIDHSFINAYTQLHYMGYAHSIEVYDKTKLIGGLYGILLGKVFFGESMFSLKANTSKIAFFYLASHLSSHYGINLIDVQQTSPHMLAWGAINISHDTFISHLKYHAYRYNSQKNWTNNIPP